MLEQLLAHIHAPASNDDGFARLESASSAGDDLTLELQVLPTTGTTPRGRWRVECSEVADYSLANATGDISFHELGHVAARQHSDPTRSLMFRNPPSSIPACIGKLWLAHERLAGPWIQFDRYRNTGMHLDGLLQAGSGVLFHGPTFLVEAYADAIADMSTGEYLTDALPSRFGDGTRFATLILGRTFVVAAGFSASRAPE